MKTSRSSNMELLRICAMLMIVAYHIYTHCISCQLTDLQSMQDRVQITLKRNASSATAERLFHF